MKPVRKKNTEDYRSNFVFAFIGANRTGKTTVAHTLAKEWRLANPNGYIISYDAQNNFRDVADEFIICNENDKYLDRLLELKDTLMIFDDYKSLMSKSIPSPKLLKLLQYRAHNNVDMIFIAHAPAHILNVLTYFITNYFIFFTLTLDGSFQKKIPNYAYCVAASNYINKWVRMNGRGQFPIFPYVGVDTQTLKITAYNIRGIGSQDITNIVNEY